MHKVAIIEAKQSRNNYRQLFNEEFEFDQLQLCSNKDIPKVLAKDVDLKVNLEDYDWVILIGSEPLKYFTKLTSIMEYSGKLVDKKFLPSMNPAMLAFKPEAKKDWVAARDNIIGYVTGTLQATEVNGEDFVGIEEEHDAESYIKAALESDKPYFAIDTETSALYPRNGYVLGISLSYTVGKGAYISSDALSPKAEELLQQLLIEKLPVFHNAKFDIAMLEYHFKFKIPKFEDTMLLHYTLDETQGSHGLKELSLKYTKWGDYERPMYDWIESYKKAHGVTKDEFKWEWIPFEVMKTYAALDANCTLALYELFKPKVDKNSKLKYVYDNILIPGTRLVIDMQDNGVPFSRERLQLCDQLLTSTIEQLNSKLRSFPEVQRLEQVLEKPLNPNSVVQLRKLFFDDLGLPVTKRTEKGEPSTDKTVLEFLSDKHEVPNVILGIRQSIKIKSTYVDKILIGLDKDDRLRTGFHLHVTSSGRLSSSGRLNMQQLPRDNPLVKGSIKAPLGRKIVAMDLGTAELYIAAALSKDKVLQKAFIDRKDFHSSIAREVFHLPCEVEEVKDLYPFERQAAKAISFGINGALI